MADGKSDRWELKLKDDRELYQIIEIAIVEDKDKLAIALDEVKEREDLGGYIFYFVKNINKGKVPKENEEIFIKKIEEQYGTNVEKLKEWQKCYDAATGRGKYSKENREAE